jgi:hypothetical protein
MTNSKSRLSSYDVVRPSNTLPPHYRTSWTTDINRPDNEYIQLQDTRSGYHPNEANSFSLDNTNDSYYPTLSHGTYPKKSRPGQYVYYDDEYGNNLGLAPEEISF